jgi:hypothetical protein
MPTEAQRQIDEYWQKQSDLQALQDAHRGRYRLIGWAVCTVIWFVSVGWIFHLIQEPALGGWFTAFYWFDVVGLWIVLTLREL